MPSALSFGLVVEESGKVGVGSHRELAVSDGKGARRKNVQVVHLPLVTQLHQLGRGESCVPRM